MKRINELPDLSPLCGLALAVGMTLLATVPAQAHPYASAVTNDAGTIKFILNENADNVGVSFDNDTATNNLGALAKGSQSFALAGHTNYAIYVYKVGAGSPVQISADTNNTVKFATPRGVAVNTNPKDRHFGLIYAANATPGGTGAATKGRGLYVLNADTSDAFGKGTNASATVFAASASSPYRLGIGPDNQVYIGDFSTAAATVWGFNADLTAGTNVLAIIGEAAGIAGGIHGDISGAPCAKGSLATGDLVLYTADAALGPLFNSIKEYDILAGPLPYSNAPTQLGCIGLCGIAELNTDLALAPDGKLFGNINRASSFSAPNLTVFAPDGVTVLWDSLTAAGGTLNVGPDVVDNARSVSVSPDNQWVALIHTDSHISVMRLINGLPDPASLFSIANLPNFTSTANTGQQIAWDAANNVYTVSRGQGLIRVWSLGQTTTAITSNDATTTNGTFRLVTPSVQVTVAATVSFASQAGPTPGVFTLTRSSTNASDLNQALTVNFTLTGTATNSVYTVAPASATNSITFAPGQTTTNITINPVVDSVPRPTTTVILSLTGGGAYSAVAPTSATITVENKGPQLLFISSAPAPSMYKGLTNDSATFAITRWGDTNALGYTVSNFTYAGTAAAGVDFTLAAPITFNPGDIVLTNQISPLIATTNYVGNKTVIVGLGVNAGYTNAAGTATLTILDNANVPATVLYANPLTDPADEANWKITAANNDMVNKAIDYSVIFGYDLTANNPLSGQYGLIPLPPSGATNALRVTVNKSATQGSGAAAGVNLYPAGLTFSNDYAVRFSMNIVEGANPSYTTEGPIFGINHGGEQTNWLSSSGVVSGGPSWGSDGVWYWVSADGGAAAGDYLEYTGLGGALPNTGWTQVQSKARTAFTGIFKNPQPYSTLNGSAAAAGLPANSSAANGIAYGGYTNAWADVEIKTVKNLVTMSINKSVVFTYTNTTTFTNGTLMFGYNDPFSSVGAPDGAVYFSDLKVVRLAGPVILTQPTNVIAAVGTPATFSVTANFDSSSAVTNGQWSLNGTNIANATNATYSFTVTPASFGTYAWSVNDGNYLVTSSNATLRPPALVINTQPISSLVLPVNTATNLSVAVSTYSGVTNYQWQFNSVNLSGATTNPLNLTIRSTNYGVYRVIVSDGWNTNISTTATISPPLPVINVAPSTRAAVLGSSASFSVVATTYSGLTNYQWMYYATNLPAATNRTLTLSNLQAASFGGPYTVRVNDGTTSITSAPPATLTVAASPRLSSPVLLSAGLTFNYGTEVGPSYVVDFKSALTNGAWVPVRTNAGTGGLINVTNATSGSQGYFRIRLQ